MGQTAGRPIERPSRLKRTGSILQPGERPYGKLDRPDCLAIGILAASLQKAADIARETLGLLDKHEMTIAFVGQHSPVG